MPHDALTDELDRRIAEMLNRCSPEYRSKFIQLRAEHDASRVAHAQRLREIFQPLPGMH